MTKDNNHQSVKWLWRTANLFISSVSLQTKKRRKKEKSKQRPRLRNGAFGALGTVFTHNQRRRFWFDRPGGRCITLSMCFELMVELFWPFLWKWIGLISTATTPALIKKLMIRNSTLQSSRRAECHFKMTTHLCCERAQSIKLVSGMFLKDKGECSC